MNKNESKYFKSAQKMQSALISLLDDKDFEMITVKEICENAGVNRSTFYLHYDNVNDLLTEAVESIYKDFFERFQSDPGMDNIRDKSDEELYFVTPQYLMPYLEFVEENRRLFHLMYVKCEVMGVEKIYTKWFIEVFSPVMTRYGIPENEQKYTMIYYMKGLMGLITEWVLDDCRISKEEMIRIIRRCIGSPKV